MSEEKKLILKMLKEGKITEDEALKLLDAVKENNNHIENDEEKTEKKTNNKFESTVHSFFSNLFNTVEKNVKKVEEKINSSNINLDDINFTFGYFGKINKELIIEDINDDINLLVDYINGKVIISSWDNDYIKCTSHILFDKNTYSEDYNFITKSNIGRDIHISTYEYSNLDKFNATLYIYLPKKYINNIKCKEITGKVIINNLMSNSIDLETTNSKIVLENVSASKEIKINGINGKFLIENISAPDLNIKNLNGKITGYKIDCECIFSENMNGSISFSNISNTAKSINLKSLNGGIYLENINYNKPTRAKLTGRFEEKLNPIFSTIVRNDTNTIAYTSDFIEDLENKLEIDIETNNGKIRIL